MFPHITVTIIVVNLKIIGNVTLARGLPEAAEVEPRVEAFSPVPQIYLTTFTLDIRTLCFTVKVGLGGAAKLLIL